MIQKRSELALEGDLRSPKKDSTNALFLPVDYSQVNQDEIGFIERELYSVCGIVATHVPYVYRKDNSSKERPRMVRKELLILTFDLAHPHAPIRQDDQDIRRHVYGIEAILTSCCVAINVARSKEVLQPV